MPSLIKNGAPMATTNTSTVSDILATSLASRAVIPLTSLKP
jgi:hypothetical protein